MIGEVIDGAADVLGVSESIVVGPERGSALLHPTIADKAPATITPNRNRLGTMASDVTPATGSPVGEPDRFGFTDRS